MEQELCRRVHHQTALARKHRRHSLAALPVLCLPGAPRTQELDDHRQHGLDKTQMALLLDRNHLQHRPSIPNGPQRLETLQQHNHRLCDPSPLLFRQIHQKLLPSLRPARRNRRKRTQGIPWKPRIQLDPHKQILFPALHVVRRHRRTHRVPLPLWLWRLGPRAHKPTRARTPLLELPDRSLDRNDNNDNSRIRRLLSNMGRLARRIRHLRPHGNPAHIPFHLRHRAEARLHPRRAARILALQAPRHQHPPAQGRCNIHSVHVALPAQARHFSFTQPRGAQQNLPRLCATQQKTHRKAAPLPHAADPHHRRPAP
eukprot:comp7778_c0_seq1/m.8009 comp7778_c0_seq1/g.8009  ORF comp7778_c0_seq1/g.8009 comp7778_c0_seq1/m.8009 type:complete len:314 (-) comp7778_c0_seq1:219-1160(-)